MVVARGLGLGREWVKVIKECKFQVGRWVDGTALLKCKATGDPLPVISWLKEGFTFLGRDPRATIQEQGTLQIKNLRVSNVEFVFGSSSQRKYVYP